MKTQQPIKLKAHKQNLLIRSPKKSPKLEKNLKKGSRSTAKPKATQTTYEQVPIKLRLQNSQQNENENSKSGQLSISNIMQRIPLIAEYKEHKIIQNKIRTKQQIMKIWKIGKVISHGSTAAVHKAYNTQTGELVAVKKMVFDKDPDLHKKQLRVLCKISHPNIVKYIQHQSVDKQTWIFMEYIPFTMLSFIKQYGIPPLQNYLRFAKQLISAVHYLHSQKVVHRDIKCSNILVDNDGTLKLSDFGCSKNFNQTISLLNYEREGLRTFKGSVLWMAPEVISQSIYNRKTDIWSMGCALLQMATGNAPWCEKKFENQMQAVWIIAAEGQTPQIPTDLSGIIKSLIGSCLKRNPEQRLTTEQLLNAPFLKIIQ